MTTRRLAAILAADVVGFSSMMEKDEEGTLARSRRFSGRSLNRRCESGVAARQDDRRWLLDRVWQPG